MEAYESSLKVAVAAPTEAARGSWPYAEFGAPGKVAEEKDIVDLDTREVLFTVEHEVRSQTHPLYGRPLLNRNPAQSNRDYKPGHDTISWAMA